MRTPALTVSTLLAAGLLLPVPTALAAPVAECGAQAADYAPGSYSRYYGGYPVEAVFSFTTDGSYTFVEKERGVVREGSRENGGYTLAKPAGATAYQLTLVPTSQNGRKLTFTANCYGGGPRVAALNLKRGQFSDVYSRVQG